jgi:hypothetical protein
MSQQRATETTARAIHCYISLCLKLTTSDRSQLAGASRQCNLKPIAI